MKKITASYLNVVDSKSPIDKISVFLDMLEKNKIDNLPWPEYDYKPEVQFAIAYNDAGIMLKYFVQEKFIRAKYTRDNEPVFEDSCVEFFISFNDEAAYYNFEFNCNGACLLGFGKEKLNRRLLSEQCIKEIKRQAIIRNSNDLNTNLITWDLTLMIPFEVFSFHQIHSINGQHVRANFYKCGDELPQPHFLTWNNIIAPTPEFHLPDFFGAIEFV
jgi:hypothetical protein